LCTSGLLSTDHTFSDDGKQCLVDTSSKHEFQFRLRSNGDAYVRDSTSHLVWGKIIKSNHYPV
jgi:hypothetical protein